MEDLMPFGKFESNIERELYNLSQREYEDLRTMVHKIQKLVGVTNGIDPPKYPHTATLVDKLERALMFLEYDHGGKFEW